MQLLRKLDARWPAAGRLIGIVLSERSYPFVLALGLAWIAGRLLIEFNRHNMAYLYLEYLANYDLGFIRRGLVPEILSLATPRLTHFDVKIFAVGMICVTLAAYVAMFARRFGLTQRELPLLALTIVSPCVFKNFVFDFARLDILGFLGAVVALALPLNGVYSIALGAMCCILILIHEAQFLTYIPAIVAIAAIRLSASPGYAFGRYPWREAVALAAIPVTLAIVLRFGGADVPADVFLAHLRAKASDPVIDRIYIWYIDASQNMQLALDPDHLWRQLRSGPKYLLILLAHLPLVLYARALAAGAAPRVRILFWLAVCAITLGFLIMATISHDRARWFANWIAGLLLVVHAIRMARPADRDDLALRSHAAVAAAWFLAWWPRVGLFTP